MKMTQTTTKYPEYDDNILAGTKSIDTKQVCHIEKLQFLL
jgi:hypothetical protein